ncbi:chloramphenicol acetyltransferase [Sulfobacillus acidophilus TPY]|nr:chloramphenicol acetyltransferase [Sulfobacillus acidophilus TPY]
MRIVAGFSSMEEESEKGWGGGMEPDLTLVRHLKAKGRFEEAQAQLQQWLAEDPANPRLLWEMAVLLDNQNKEADAVLYYQRAIELGLDRMHLADAYLGWGSSLRVVGRYSESRQVLERGIAEFPHHAGLKVFHALTLWTLDNYGDAFGELLEVIVKTAADETLEPYRATLAYYRDHWRDRS